MKKSVLVGILVFCSMVIAGEGQAVVPSWLKSSTNYSQIELTNLSSEEVTVFITFYDVNGTVYNESSETGTNFTVSVMSGDPLSTSGATLASGKTGTIEVSATGSFKKGYAIVSWSSSGDSRVALMGFVRNDSVTADRLGRGLIPINNWKIF